MEIYHKLISNPRGLEIEPLKITEYNIFGVKVAEHLDTEFRRTAIATVVIKNDEGIWDVNTMHYIELKHCYNNESHGPTRASYEKLTDFILVITDIQSSTHGDLDIITWYLVKYQPTLLNS